MNQLLSSRLDLILGSSRVKRWHRQVTIKDQTVGEHTYSVMWLVLILTNFEASARLLTAALAHDSPEYITGDLPAPTKRLPGVAAAVAAQEAVVLSKLELEHVAEDQLPFEELVILKCADGLEGALFCLTEMEMGNTKIRQSLDNYISYLKELFDKSAVLDRPGAARDIFNYIKESRREFQ